MSPFTRCLRCDSLLENADKSEVLYLLEPLTRLYYEHFRRCPQCGQVYWPGSHFEKLTARVADLERRLILHLPNSSKPA